MTSSLMTLVLALLATTPAAARAGWQPVERGEHYQVRGSTGSELYRSIGEHGPKAGPGRAIAFTTYELLWSRDYRPEAGGCTLKTARPRLTIIYRLPKPSGKLAPPLDRVVEIGRSPVHRVR